MTKPAKKSGRSAVLNKETIEGAGRWVESVFGEGFRQLGGAFTDYATGFRYRNRINVLQKTHKAIADAGFLKELRPLSDRIALPLLDAIGDESDDSIQDVWAAYIRSAVNPKLPNPDKAMIDIIRKLEPVDLPVLKKIFDLKPGKYSCDDFGLQKTDAELIFDRLSEAGLLTIEDNYIGYIVIGDPRRRQPTEIVIENLSYTTTRTLDRLKLLIS